jgi:hypothetical protein
MSNSVIEDFRKRLHKPSTPVGLIVLRIIEGLAALASIWAGTTLAMAFMPNDMGFFEKSVRFIGFNTPALLLIACILFVHEAHGSFLTANIAVLILCIIIDIANLMISGLVKMQVDLYGWADFYVLYISPILPVICLTAGILLGWHHPASVKARINHKITSDKDELDNLLTLQDADTRYNSMLQEAALRLKLDTQVLDMTSKLLGDDTSIQVLQEQARGYAQRLLGRPEPTAKDNPNE